MSAKAYSNISRDPKFFPSLIGALLSKEGHGLGTVAMVTVAMVTVR